MSGFHTHGCGPRTALKDDVQSVNGEHRPGQERRAVDGATPTLHLPSGPGEKAGFPLFSRGL